MDWNCLGISYVSDDVPKHQKKKVEEKMDEIIEKYRDLMQEEFGKFLEAEGLASDMGIVYIPNKPYNRKGG